MGGFAENKELLLHFRQNCCNLNATNSLDASNRVKVNETTSKILQCIFDLYLCYNFLYMTSVNNWWHGISYNAIFYPNLILSNYNMRYAVYQNCRNGKQIVPFTPEVNLVITSHLMVRFTCYREQVKTFPGNWIKLYLYLFSNLCLIQLGKAFYMESALFFPQTFIRKRL